MKKVLFTPGMLTLALTATSSLAYAGTPLFIADKSMQSVSGFNQVSPVIQSIQQFKPLGLLTMKANAQALALKEVDIQLPDGEIVTFVQSHINALNGKRLHWQGNVFASEGTRQAKVENQANFIVNGNDITGSFHYQGNVYQISPLGSGQHAIVKRNPDMVEDEHERMQDASPVSLQLDLAPSSISTLAVGPTERVTLKVNVAYTAATRNAFSSLSALNDHIALAVAETNQGYQNSNVYIDLELAHSFQVSYSESGDIGRDVDRMVAKSDGYMDELHTIRDQYNADVTVLLVASGGAGVASGIDVQESEAFAISHYSNAIGYYTFGHEIGHLQGAYHNPETGHINRAYPYAQGYQEPGHRWRTIMSYNCSSGCDRINYWSNPGITYTDGRVMGDSTDGHNQRRLNETRERFSNFRSDGPVDPGTTFSSDTNVDIPDNTSYGESPISVNKSGAAGNVSVSVDIRHTWQGDLTVSLIDPQGNSYTLRSASGGSTDNIIESYSLGNLDVSAAGTWRLRVADGASRDIGYINSWSITFN